MSGKINRLTMFGLDKDLQEKLGENTTTLFKIVEFLHSINLLNYQNDKSMTFFTVKDDIFLKLIPQWAFDDNDYLNPYIHDPGLAKFVLSLQAVNGNIKPCQFNKSNRFTTIGNRNLELNTNEKGNLTVNGVEVEEMIETENSTLYIMKKLLWLRPEDVDAALGNLKRKKS